VGIFAPFERERQFQGPILAFKVVFEKGKGGESHRIKELKSPSSHPSPLDGEGVVYPLLALLLAMLSVLEFLVY
jgi:hypothetical protein